tara:strand:- start:2174 stop:3028 length:855 start_codon:yes stop_codon:yes gene_type:complete
MPSTSKTQQRLMGVAYSVKNGDTQLSDVDPTYKDKVADLVDGMTLKQLKDFASTPHEDLPEEVSEGIMKIDKNRVLTSVMKGLGFKQDPKMREELKAAFLKDIESILSKYDYVIEAEDHEVGMLTGQLSAIHTAAGELEEKIGTEEKDIPAWIQSHITSAYEYLKQANDNFHELEENITPTMLKGMGAASLPNAGTPGSGDVPAGSGDAEEEYKKKKKLNKLLTLEEYILEQDQAKAFTPKQGREEELGSGEYSEGPANDADLESRAAAKVRELARNIVGLHPK